MAVDFINRLRERDDEIFVGLCFIFYKQLSAIHKQDKFGEYSCTLPDAPDVRACFRVGLDNTKVEFVCTPAGLHFRLAGEVVARSRLSQHSTVPSKKIHDLYFIYEIEHSKLLNYRDFDHEMRRKNRVFKDSEEHDAALDAWIVDVDRQTARLNKWWANIETTEILARVAA